MVLRTPPTSRTTSPTRHNFEMALPTEQAKMLELIKRKNKDFKARVTRFNTFIDKQKEDPDKEEIEAKLSMLKETFNALVLHHENNSIHLQIEVQDVQSEELMTIEDNYSSAVAKAKKLFQQIHNPLVTESPSTNQPFNVATAISGLSSSLNNIRLPQIALPQFDGSIEDWPAFRDKFLARVENNTMLSAVDKFEYLQASLSGKAARAIEALESTSKNYTEAWGILISKYDNTRKNILRHWSILQDTPKLQRDTPEGLDELVDTFKQHLRALKNLGDSIQENNSFITHLILSKISEHTMYQWETTLQDNKMPPYTSLLDFLEKRSRCSNLFPSKPLNNVKKIPDNNNSRVKSKQTFFVNTDNKRKTSCPICQKEHKIYTCSVFLKLSPEKRNKAVTDASLCYNCLAWGHSVRECKSRSCSVCQKRHHSLIHLGETVINKTPPTTTA